MDIHLSKPTLTAKGCTWCVHFEGQEIVANSYDPEFAACRELLARGIKGKVTTYRDGQPCMTLDIEKAANRRTRDNKTGTPVIRNLGVIKSALETDKTNPDKFPLLAL